MSNDLNCHNYRILQVGGLVPFRPLGATSPLLQRPSTALHQGLRLSELVPQAAARGLPAVQRSPTFSGGPGGPHDPWKALAIRWDYGTPQQWPIRVSPWEVSIEETTVTFFHIAYAHMFVESRPPWQQLCSIMCD